MALEHVTKSIVRIPLPLPLEDLHEVNAYAILGSDGVTLVDPGWSTADNETTLIAALAQLGHVPADVIRLLVTHSHWDHYTQAVKWQREHGAELMIGRGEQHSIAAFDTLHGSYPRQIELLRRAGAESIGDLVEAIPLEPHETGVPIGPADVWLDGGDVIDCGGVEVVAHATPGHTRGHVVFGVPADNLLMTGDHILPRITPSVSFEREPEALPLRSYLGSLQYFLDRPDGRMLPAHGAIADSVQERAAELLDHHAQRLKVVCDLVATGSRTAADVARRMRWTRRELTLGELGPVHGMTAVLEVVAHLELLVDRNALTQDTSGEVQTFAIR